MVGIFFLLISIYFVVSYNRLTSDRQNVIEAWSGIDVQLKRRHDLIPNLVQLVNAYATYEKNTLEELTQLRTRFLAIGPNDISAKSDVEQQIQKHLDSVVAIAEKYPDLKANTNYLKLQDELTETEDQIASARRIYNSNTADYNTRVMIFPNNLIAPLFHFTPYGFFQNDATA